MRDVLVKGEGNRVKGTGGGTVRCQKCEKIFRGERAEAGKANGGEGWGGAFWIGIGVIEELMTLTFLVK